MNQIFNFLSNFNLKLIILLAILFFYFWYAFSIIYHLIRFGIGTQPKIISLIFFLGSFLMFVLVINSYFRVDLQNIFNPIGGYSP